MATHSNKEYNKGWRKRHPGYMKNRTDAWRKAYPRKAILARAQDRAKKKGFEFRLKLEDIPEIPEFCPVFPWIRLEYRVGEGLGYRDSAPSLDRIKSDLGYVPGNVRIISDRANRLKSNASLRELQALVADEEAR